MSTPVEAPGTSGEPGHRAQVAAVVCQVIAQILPGLPRAVITGDKHLKDLGADSVDRVEIILLLRERLGCDEPLASFSNLPNLEALVDFLAQLRSQ